MRLHRFFVEEDLGRETVSIFDEKLLHQLRDVFRLGTGDRVIFFNQPTSEADGFDYLYEVDFISKKEASFRFISKSKNFIPKQKVTLLMSVIKKENFELVVEKAVELGVSEIVPIVTERTLVKNLNTERLRKIIVEASEQCGRGDVPMLSETIDLETALQNFSDIIAFDISGGSLEASSSKLSTPSFLIGPEGGWSESELALIREKNILIAKLGDTTLRAETAAIVACAKVLLI